VVEDLHHKLGVPVHLDKHVLAGVGVDADTRVTFAVSDISAKSAIALLLRQLKLTSVVLRETLLITTAEEANEELETRVYDVSDLPQPNDMSWRQPQTAAPSFDEMIDVISHTVQPTTWGNASGPGSIRPFEAAGIRALAVNQTTGVHAALESLFAQLRAIRVRRERAQGQMASDEQAEAAVDRALQTRLTFDFQSVPLREVAERLSRRAGVPIVLDRAVIDDFQDLEPASPPKPQAQATKGAKTPKAARKAGPSEPFDMPVTAKARDVTLETALYLVLRPLRLVWTYDCQCLVITTDEAVDRYPR
jgi:hypothetical protein